MFGLVTDDRAGGADAVADARAPHQVSEKQRQRGAGAIAGEVDVFGRADDSSSRGGDDRDPVCALRAMHTRDGGGGEAPSPVA
jgi:hypothetical protein